MASSRISTVTFAVVLGDPTTPTSSMLDAFGPVRVNEHLGYFGPTKTAQAQLNCGLQSAQAKTDLAMTSARYCGYGSRTNGPVIWPLSVEHSAFS